MAQEGSESDSATKPVYNILPFVYYLPETSLGFGVGGVVSFRFKGELPTSKASQVQIGASYTLLNQYLFYFPYRLFWKNNKYLAYGEVGYYRYTYNYYGIGPEVPASNEESYDLLYPRIRASVLQELWPQGYLGLRYWYDNFDITDIEENGLLDTTQTLGKRGGAAAGLGLVTNYDSRDNQFYPTQGYFVEGVALPHFAAVGSDFAFLKLSLDASRYFPLKKKQVIAVNLYLESNIGEVPFYQLALLGGSKRMRGFYEGRFRDRHAAIVQAAYRCKFYKRFGLALFYAAGNVAEGPASFQFSETKQAVGGGLRFQLSKREKVNLRLDAALTNTGEANFYLTFGEAF